MLALEQSIDDMEQSVLALEQSIDDMEQSVLALEQSIDDMEQSVLALEQSIDEIEQSVLALAYFVDEICRIRHRNTSILQCLSTPLGIFHGCRTLPRLYSFLLRSGIG